MSALINRLWLFIYTLIFLFWYFRECYVYEYVGLDASVFLGCAGQLLDGQKVFLDVFEINPPLITYISMIPMQLSRAAGLDPAYAFLVFVIAVAATSMVLANLALRRATEAERLVCNVMLAACFLGFSFSAQNILGQREQLFVMLYLPFFFIRWLRNLDRKISLPLAICIGILAGIGTAIKPHFALIPMAIELVLLAQYRRVSSLKASEVVAFLSIVPLYLAHYIFWDPAALNYFLNEHIPDVLKNYHCADCTFTAAALVKKEPYALVLAVISLLWAGLMLRRDKLIPVLMAWIVSSYILFVIQMKGWHYQAIPLLSGIYMTIAALSVITLRFFLERSASSKGTVAEQSEAISNGSRIGPFMQVYATLQVVLLVVLLMRVTAPALFPTEGKSNLPLDLVPIDKVFKKYTVPGDSVSVVALDCRRLEQVLLAHRLKMGWRYSWGYPMEFLIYDEQVTKKRGGTPQLQDKWKKVLKTASDDVMTRRPKLILLDRTVHVKMAKLGLLDETVANYRQLDTIAVEANPVANGLLSVYVLKDPERGK